MIVYEYIDKIKLGKWLVNHSPNSKTPKRKKYIRSHYRNIADAFLSVEEVDKIENPEDRSIKSSADLLLWFKQTKQKFKSISRKTRFHEFYLKVVPLRFIIRCCPIIIPDSLTN
jgi:hypothetical protein